MDILHNSVRQSCWTTVGAPAVLKLSLEGCGFYPCARRCAWAVGQILLYTMFYHGLSKAFSSQQSNVHFQALHQPLGKPAMGQNHTDLTRQWRQLASAPSSIRSGRNPSVLQQYLTPAVNFTSLFSYLYQGAWSSTWANEQSTVCYLSN